MRKWKTVLSLVLVAVMLCMFEVPVNAAGVIYISSESELKSIADAPYGHYVLTGDIELSDSQWTNLGIFYGILDGAGYAITNLKSTGDGLFDTLGEGSVVKNLTISGELQIEDDLGAFLAGLSDGMVSDCTTQGVITVTDGAAAGLMVYNRGLVKDCVNEAVIENGDGGIVANNLGTVIGCTNKGDIISDVMYPGGIVGINNDLIMDCVNYGNVTATLEDAGYNLAVGGIAGTSNGFVYRCENYGEVKQQAKRNGNAGGIVGELNGYAQLVGCENAGTVSGIGKMGGICGSASLMGGTFDENDEFTSAQGELLISDCINSGTVRTVDMVSHTENGAGIVGDVSLAGGNMRILNCSNLGAVIGVGNDVHCGGCVGSVLLSDECVLTLQELYNSGDVTAEFEGDDDTFISTFAAGIFSRIQNDGSQEVKIVNCKNTGKVQANSAYGFGVLGANCLMQYCANTGDVYGTNGAYGFAGDISEGTQILDCYSLGTISGKLAYGVAYVRYETIVLRNCYYYGDLIGTDEEGVIERYYNGESATIENCYYLQQDMLNGQSAGTALPADAMRLQTSYTGFDFDNVWEMQEQNGVILPAIKKIPDVMAAALQSTQVALRPGDVFIPQAASGTIVSYYSDNYVLLGDADLFDDDNNIKARGLGTVTVYCVFSDGQVIPCNVTITETGEPLIEPSAEIIAFVQRMYNLILGREAEAEGLESWSYSLANYQADGAGLARGFVLSPEFTNKGLTDAEFVEILYLTFLNRAGDVDGVSFWAGELAKGSTRPMVLSGFVNSVEFSGICDSYDIARGTMQQDGTVFYNKGTRDFVERMYVKVLERDGETMGIESWTNLILLGVESPETVAFGYFHSDEYINKNTTNAKYVETLYETFLDRKSDVSGRDFWVNQIEAGMSRDAVLEGFSRSTEFAELMASYGL